MSEGVGNGNHFCSQRTQRAGPFLPRVFKLYSHLKCQEAQSGWGLPRMAPESETRQKTANLNLGPSSPISLWSLIQVNKEMQASSYNQKSDSSYPLGLFWICSSTYSAERLPVPSTMLRQHSRQPAQLCPSPQGGGKGGGQGQDRKKITQLRNLPRDQRLPKTCTVMPALWEKRSSPVFLHPPHIYKERPR